MRSSFVSWSGWPKERTAVIAEVGINPGGDVDLAWEIVLSAYKNGADFVKLQTFQTSQFMHPELEYYKSVASMELSAKDTETLFQRAQKEGISLVTTPFDFASVDLVDKFAPAFYKVASMDNDNKPLIQYIAGKKRPMVVSCGMATLDEIHNVVKWCREAGNNQLVLLHCVSDYPAAPESLNLEMIPYLRHCFDVPIGLSDHSLGLDSSLMAAALGAAVIEKHYTTDPGLLEKIPDADHDISIVPEQLKELSRFCKLAPVMIGSAPRVLSEGEEQGRKTFRRGLYASKAIAKNGQLTMENTVLLRPVKGIAANQWPEVEGTKTLRAIEKYQAIRFSDLDI
jgi:N,N'-diacetyllegionaminate synthase